MELRDTIAALATPAAESAGLVVDDVSVSPAGKGTLVVVTVDLPEDQVGGADLDVVAAASRAISAALDDAAEAMPASYTLEVSTPGVDRTLTELRHFRRARTRRVRVDFNDDRALTGRLLDVIGDDGPVSLVLATDDGEVMVPFADVVSGQVLIEMTRN